MTAEMLRPVVVEGLDELQRHREAWDRLAVSNAMPYGSPAWLLSWWHHVAPANALLRTVLVFAGDDLVGLAPFFADRGVGGIVRYRLLGSSRRDLLVDRALEHEVAAVVTRALGHTDPRPDVFMLEGVPRNREWPRIIAEMWHRGHMKAYQQFSQPVPTVNLVGRTYDDWFRSKSRNFRQGMRRSLRQLEAAGARIRLASDAAELRAGLDAFARLHHQRWSSRGGSGVLNERVERMLGDVAPELVGQRRFRLWSIEVEGDIISSHIFISAGGETAYWLGGFDEAHGRFKPSIVTILCAIEHAFSVGDRRVNLGPGGQPYKYRFSDGEESVDWTLLVRAGLRAPVARWQMLPQRTRMMLAQRLPPSAKKLARRPLKLLSTRQHPRSPIGPA